MKNKKKEKKKILDENLIIVIEIILSLFCFFLIFIEGENLWFIIRKFFLGLFGINFIFIPSFLLTIVFLKLKNGNVDKFKSIMSCIFYFLFSSLVGIFSFPLENCFTYFYEKGLRNAGIISGSLDILLVKFFGISATKAILSLLFLLTSAIIFKINIFFIFDKLKSFFQTFGLNLSNSFSKLREKQSLSQISVSNEEVKEVVNMMIQNFQKKTLMSQK